MKFEFYILPIAVHQQSNIGSKIRKFNVISTIDDGIVYIVLLHTAQSSIIPSA